MKKLACILAFGGLSLVGCKSRSEEYCRQALRETNQIMASLQAALGGGSSGSAAIPEEPFVSRCRQLAPDVAHCAVPSYSNTHHDECERHRTTLRALR